MRIILDTNWYVSATINRASRRRLHYLLTRQNLTILYAKELIEEYQAVIFREKFQRYIHRTQIERFLALVLSRLEVVEIKEHFTGSRDPKDNYLLSLSVAGNADYLVTGDPDLLLLEQFENTVILNMAEFLKIIQE